MLQSIVRIFLDLLFPEKCLACQVEGSFLCDRCFLRIKLKKIQMCPVCKKSSYQGITHRSSCASQTHLDGLLVASSYHENPILERTIKQFKYHYSQDVGQKLGKLLSRVIQEAGLEGDVVLLPIPLHAKRKQWRGFNQAEVLASIVAETLKLPVVELLQRVKNTKQQAKLNRSERLQNLENAFAIQSGSIGSDLRSKTIVLVDDVSSTLATLNEAAKALKQAGCRKVIGAVLARG